MSTTCVAPSGLSFSQLMDLAGQKQCYREDDTAYAITVDPVRTDRWILNGDSLSSHRLHRAKTRKLHEEDVLYLQGWHKPGQASAKYDTPSVNFVERLPKAQHAWGYLTRGGEPMLTAHQSSDVSKLHMSNNTVFRRESRHDGQLPVLEKLKREGLPDCPPGAIDLKRERWEEKNAQRVFSLQQTLNFC